MSALDAMLRREWELEVWRSYQAEAMRSVLSFFGAKDVQRYEDLITPQEPGKTAEQIAEQRRRLLDGLRGD